MVLFGLVIVLLGVCILLAGLFASGYDSEGGAMTNELLQINMPVEVLFLFGVASGALMLLGVWIMKRGAQQGWKHRQERKRLGELSDKLDQVEAERRAEGEQP
jgi:hypothetical protein